jgi:hypothetical protein
MFSSSSTTTSSALFYQHSNGPLHPTGGASVQRRGRGRPARSSSHHAAIGMGSRPFHVNEDTDDDEEEDGFPFGQERRSFGRGPRTSRLTMPAVPRAAVLALENIINGTIPSVESSAFSCKNKR